MKSPIHHITITVIGCGGTGSHFVMLLARMIHAYRCIFADRDISVCLCDGDTVSHSNISRQAFVESELNYNKAEALVNRYNRMYGYNWQAYPDYMTSTTLEKLKSNIIISCVDKIKPRRIIDAYFKFKGMMQYEEDAMWGQPMLWIDTGNTKSTSNIFCSVPSDLTIIDRYPNLEDDDSLPSCSTAQALSQQSLFINTITADIAALMLWDLLYLFKVPEPVTFINLNTLKISQSNENNNQEWASNRLASADKGVVATT
jgi:PRTRC genetic system ThiF family protein